MKSNLSMIFEIVKGKEKEKEIQMMRRRQNRQNGPRGSSQIVQMA